MAPPRSLRLASVLFAAGVMPLALTAGINLPPIAGEISGDLTPLALKGPPPLHWKITLQTPSAVERTATLSVDGPDTRLRAEIHLDATGDGVWRVTEGKILLKPWLGGQLLAGEADLLGEGAISQGAINGNLTLRLTGIDLGELLRFADAEKKYFRTAEGRVEGTVNLRVRDGALAPGECELQLAPGTIALVSMQPAPGLLSGYVPEQVRKLYPGIEAIEQGRTPLEARVLRLTFHPDGDSEGRSAKVRIEGRPRDPKLIAPLELDVNLSGPVESLVRKMLDSRLQLGAAK